MPSFQAQDLAFKTPLVRYQYDLEHNGFNQDPAQYHAVQKLDALFHQVINLESSVNEAQSSKVKSRFLSKLFSSQASTPTINMPKGVYFWGGVGRGKTYLMDLFFDVLPYEKKVRFHFHHFMQKVHQELKTLQSVSDPLQIVADRFKKQADVVCFDEFYVSDITDAMILGTLFEALFERGIILIATSNIEPKNLYKNGLQRARFLPAIALLEKHCEIVNIDSGIDYRLRTLTQAEIYHYPLDEAAQENLQNYYQQLTHDKVCTDASLEINQREMNVIAHCGGVLHTNFDQLCKTARSANDYIEIARRFHTVLLADVPTITAALDDAARRFIIMVDEFYERKVTLIISSQVSLEMLYQGRLLSFEFERCQSRLIEMQSQDYLKAQHLP